MAWHPLTVTSSIIRVSSAGTPVQISSTRQPFQSVLIQALPNNASRIVVGSDNTVRAGANAATDPSGTVLAIIGAPSANTATPPSANGGNPVAPAAFNLQDLWLDAVSSNDGVIVSFIR